MTEPIKFVDRAPAVKCFAAVLYRDSETLQELIPDLETLFSAIDYKSQPVAFNFSDYYEPEMGANLQRCLLSFQELIAPEMLPEIKLRTRDLENRGRTGKDRLYNIDPGYLDLFKVVLASFKERGHKLYLGRGVWADMTLTFQNNGFQSFPWTFPDFKSGCFDSDLLRIRERFKSQRKTI